MLKVKDAVGGMRAVTLSVMLGLVNCQLIATGVSTIFGVGKCAGSALRQLLWKASRRLMLMLMREGLRERTLLPLNNCGSPCQSSAETYQQKVIAAGDAMVSMRFIQGDGYGAG